MMMMAIMVVVVAMMVLLRHGIGAAQTPHRLFPCGRNVEGGCTCRGRCVAFVWWPELLRGLHLCD